MSAVSTLGIDEYVVVHNSQGGSPWSLVSLRCGMVNRSNSASSERTKRQPALCTTDFMEAGVLG